MELSFALLDSSSPLFSWVILPILICLSRIIDQTLGSLRLIFLAKGQKYIVPFLGFFEVIIWLLTVAEIMKHLDNALCYIAYGAGFAIGNFIGMMIEERLSLGTVLIRIIPKKETFELVNHLREENFGVTTTKADGKNGSVQIVMTITKRKNINEVIDIINQHNPNAFYTIEDIRTVKEGIDKPTRRSTLQLRQWGLRKN